MSDAERDWDAVLATLREEVARRLKKEDLPDTASIAQLARDYRSWQRMGHAPERARRLARQIRFQHRIYNATGEDELSLRITGLLAGFYEQALANGQSERSDSARPQSGQ